MAKKNKDQKEPMPLISFKIAKELYDELEKLGKNEIDDAGNPLGQSAMARKIVRDHLLKLQKK